MPSPTPLLVLSLAAALVCGADFTPPAEAGKAFSAQAKGATAPDRPAVVGSWVWSGRADAQYRPFFEWDLRLAAGPAALAGLKARVTTLGPKQETLRAGDWVDLGAIAAKAARDVALRLNCPTFVAWKLELTWQGGAGTWIGPDRNNLPISMEGTADQAVVIAVGGDAEPVKGGKGVLATWNLWNLGGKPATGVTQIVRLRSDTGKVVATGESTLGKDEAVPPRSSKPCKLALPPTPTWASVSVETRMPDAPAGPTVLIPPKSEGADLAVLKLTLDGEKLVAEIANHLGRPLSGATVTIAFLNGGKPAKDVAVPVGELADKASTTATIAVGRLPAWDEYTVSWKPAQ